MGYGPRVAGRPVRKVDVAIACALTAWMLGEVWAEQLRPTAVAAPLMVVAGVALVWRRSYAVVVALVMVLAMIGQAAAGMTMHSADSPVFAMLVASWSIGA